MLCEYINSPAAAEFSPNVTVVDFYHFSFSPFSLDLRPLYGGSSLQLFSSACQFSKRRYRFIVAATTSARSPVWRSISSRRANQTDRSSSGTRSLNSATASTICPSKYNLFIFFPLSHQIYDFLYVRRPCRVKYYFNFLRVDFVGLISRPGNILEREMRKNGVLGAIFAAICRSEGKAKAAARASWLNRATNRAAPIKSRSNLCRSPRY
jgi:hypothetical protein